MHEYRGHFEVHLTAHAPVEAAWEQFREWCRRREMKCVRIVLARGRHADQPMATWRRLATTLTAVVQDAERQAAEARAEGIAVVRLKVEAAPDNEDVPRDDEAAAHYDARNYFEHHIKLLRPADAPAGELLAACERLGAHLSRNAFRQMLAGQEERFVTLRTYLAGRDASERQLHTVLAALEKLGECVLERESEYCVYDSHLELDRGWLSPE